MSKPKRLSRKRITRLSKTYGPGPYFGRDPDYYGDMRLMLEDRAATDALLERANNLLYSYHHRHNDGTALGPMSNCPTCECIVDIVEALK